MAEERTGSEGHGFEPSALDKSVVAIPLLEKMDEVGGRKQLYVIIDLNLLHPGGLDGSREQVHAMLAGLSKRSLDEVIDRLKGEYTPQYVYAHLTSGQIRLLVKQDADQSPHAFYRIWPDFEVETLLTASVATVKADAARIAFDAAGEGIVWAVADTGIDADHPHFATHDNLNVLQPLAHMDFTSTPTAEIETPVDPHGHGTHVAGIIAGESVVEKKQRPNPDLPDEEETYWKPELWAGTAIRDDAGKRTYQRWQLEESISGVAPKTKLVSLRVLNDGGTGRVSSLLAATGYIQKVNDYGRRIRIHGVNMSVGYGFDPEWFACGQSPLCVEVNRLVNSGVSVVVAAGNTGYWNRGGAESNLNAGLDLTINDPGNAESAITVGATHREEPHTYGVSYFSSKGPTGDGRLKPDLVAPGEKVLSCAAGAGAVTVAGKAGGEIDYREESGTSMAAPHVSGAIAALLSIRSEFKGRPKRVKEIILTSATDLGRERYFQGYGLVDVMRAIQSI
jgi:subtilisin family serine protease